MSGAYEGKRVVGMNLHSRRSALVRMTEAGEVLETTRISNDPEDPAHRRVRGDQPLHRRFGSDQRDVGQAVAAQRRRHRQIRDHLAGS